MTIGSPKIRIAMTPLERTMGRVMRGPEHPETGGVENTGDELDTEAALADISSDLFGQEGGDEGEGSSKVGAEEVPGTPSQVEPPPPQTEAKTPEELAAEVAAKAEENSAEVQATGAPKTWSKDAIETWATIPPRAQQEILKREEDMFRGLEQYREKAELGGQYDKVVEPYRAILAAEKINPVELFQNFAGNHYLLSRGTQEQKLQIFKSFADFYKIDMPALIGMVGEPLKVVDPEIQALKDEIERLKGSDSAREQAALQARQEEFAQQVEAFASDPKNAHFSDVADDIATLLKTGVAKTLQDAYDKAVWNNPVTRQKEVDRLAAEKTSEAQRIAAEKVKEAERAKAANVKSSTKTKDGTVPVGSMDDTLHETMSKISARG